MAQAPKAQCSARRLIWRRFKPSMFRSLTSCAEQRTESASVKGAIQSREVETFSTGMARPCSTGAEMSAFGGKADIRRTVKRVR